MRTIRTLLILMIAFRFEGFFVHRSFAEESVLPPGDTSPLLRLETNGPRSYVSGLAFSPDGQHLYATGWDKAVQVWNLQPDQKYEYSSGATLRVPTGAGPFGDLNGIAVSSNGKWLATAGQGQPREVPGEKSIGWVLPAGILSEQSQLDHGMIYVFNTQTRVATLLRGHRGPVQALTFVRDSQFDPPQLVSIAEEHVDGTNELVSQVRCWDLGQSKEIGKLNTVPSGDGKQWGRLPSLNGFRPGLTAWSAGAKSNQVRVALAWGDDQFRIWDVQTGQVANAKSNPNILAVLPTTDRTDQLITGAHAEIGVWTIPRGDNGQLGALAKRNFQLAQIETVNGKDQNLANAAVLIPSKNGVADQIAFVVTRYLANATGEYRIIIATAKSPMKTIREVELPWRGEIRQPSIAVSPDGKRLALAGNERHEIEIHLVENLLAGRNTPVQVLGSVGQLIRDAIFVQAGDLWGIQISNSKRDANGNLPPDSLVFDISQRQIEKASVKWSPAISSIEGWKAVASARGAVSIQRPAKSTLELKLLDDHIPTAYAFCPVSLHCPVPLVAISSELRGQPLLQMFNGDTGESLRWCSGHTERVRALSFSKDGRMLLSVGEDRTVCVWTTTDLAARTINQHGQITGLTVHVREKKLIVTEVASGSELAKGDEILAAVRGGEILEVNTAKDFYRFAWEQLPGSVVEFSIRRANELKLVKCPVGQATDESKPLFTLFVAPGKRANEWEWIGWSPFGNFDFRGDRIDQWLGWHFNTDDPKQPAKFAPIGEYRDAFYRRDLLQTLVEQQKLPPAAIVEPDLNVSMWFRRQDGTPIPQDYDDIHQLDTKSAELVAEVSGLADRQIQSVWVSIDGAVPSVLSRSESASEWTLDLSNVNWQRGPHRLSLRLKTSEREYAFHEQVHYRPATPAIIWEASPEFDRPTSLAEVKINAIVTPSSEPTQVQLLLQSPGKKESVVLRTWEVTDPHTISETVSIEPGDNQLEIVAWNSNVPVNQRDMETAKKSQHVRRATPPKAPRIAVTEISSILASGDATSLVANGDTYYSVSPLVRIRGSLEAVANIGQASLAIGETQKDLTGFRPGIVREFPFEEQLNLQPGRQSIVVHSAVDDVKDEKRLMIAYEPVPPQIASMTANVKSLRETPKAANSDGAIFYQNYHEQAVTISAVLSGTEKQPYRVVLRANDVVIAEDALTIDKSTDDQHRLTATIPLVGGRNNISLRIDNEWTRQPSRRTLEVDFRRPPEILEIQAPERLAEQTIDIACRIRSPLPLRTTKFLVDKTDEITGLISAVEGAADEYLMLGSKIGLSEGKHEITVIATNDEGTSLEPASHNVTIEKTTIKPPKLALIGPTDTAVAVSARRIELQFQVDSTVPAELQIKNRGSRLNELTIPAEEVPIDGSKGLYILDLLEGVNDIELTAHSSGGFSEKRTLKVSYVPTAALVEITSIDDQQPRKRNDGSGQFEQSVSKARVKLRGRVKIKDRLDSGASLKARIWVNNFKLPTTDVAIDAADPTVGTFTSEVTLSRAKKNEIKVEVYGDEGHIASELGCTKTLSIDCEKPERRQDLYLVLLGTGNEASLREHAQAALQAKVKTKAESSLEMWESEAFSQVHVFDAMNIHPVTVQHRLLNLVRTMNGNLKSNSKSGSQAIVMVYFQGQIALTTDDFTFETVTSQAHIDKAITGKRLQSTLSNTYGAHLIFLDLTQNTKNLTASDIWPRAPHLGIIVSNWVGNGQQPEETRLITALEQTMPQIRIVRDLADKIDQRYQTARRKFPDQIETVDRLQDLRDLRIGVLD